jgi:hypothetical protein
LILKNVDAGVTWARTGARDCPVAIRIAFLYSRHRGQEEAASCDDWMMLAMIG